MSVEPSSRATNRALADLIHSGLATTRRDSQGLHVERTEDGERELHGPHCRECESALAHPEEITHRECFECLDQRRYGHPDEDSPAYEADYR